MWYKEEGSDLVGDEAESQKWKKKCASLTACCCQGSGSASQTSTSGSTSSSFPPTLALGTVSVRQFSSQTIGKPTFLLSQVWCFFFPYSLSLPFLPQLCLFSGWTTSFRQVKMTLQEPGFRAADAGLPSSCAQPLQINSVPC